MISKYLREQKRYTQRELCNILECSEEKIVPIIRRLKEYGVLKAVKASEAQRNMSDLIEEDIEVADVEAGEHEYLYVFTFVGVIAVAGRVLKCYPKYLLSNQAPQRELKQIIKVLERYNAKEQIVRMYSDSSEGKAFNLLAVLLFLLNDYYENGLYTNSQEVIESNGNGEILWERTINETFTLIYQNRPYYPDLQTKRRVVDDFDFFKRLHECILSRASAELREADLLELFDILPVELSEETLEDFGDRDYILYRIERELNVQFNTRKQVLLKTLYSYISHSGGLYDVDAFSLFGTNSFNLVWEKVCADVMNNQLNVPLSALPLPVPLHSSYYGQRNNPLISLIEKPIWSGSGYSYEAPDTLIPDLISVAKVDGICKFIIFDAKYYTPQLEEGKPLKAQPGIESVTKQYLYQLAFRPFVEHHDIHSVANCFLMPTEGPDIIDKGTASMPMLDALGLEKILVRFIPATLMYDHYISGTKIDITLLRL